MNYEFKKVEKLRNSNSIYDIVYNGKSYGQWDDESNIEYPEDLTLGRDLRELIDIGIDIGKQMVLDGLKDAINNNDYGDF